MITVRPMRKAVTTIVEVVFDPSWPGSVKSVWCPAGGFIAGEISSMVGGISDGSILWMFEMRNVKAEDSFKDGKGGMDS